MKSSCVTPYFDSPAAFTLLDKSKNFSALNPTMFCWHKSIIAARFSHKRQFFETFQEYFHSFPLATCLQELNFKLGIEIYVNFESEMNFDAITKFYQRNSSEKISSCDVSVEKSFNLLERARWQI